MNRQFRFWLDWIVLAFVVLWALALAVESRRNLNSRNIVGRSLLIFSSPFLQTTDHLRERVSIFFVSAFQGKALYQDNQEYKAQVRRLELEVAHLNETVRRLQRLTKIEVKPLNDNYRLVLAQVIGRGRDTYTEGLLISLGSLDGLEVGLPVVHQNAAIVGTIREVNERTSYIQLLSDPNCILSCAVENSNESGIVRGLGAQSEYLEFLPRLQTSTLSQGARLVTSGLSGSLYPGGLKIGDIVRVEPNDSGERVGQVKPSINFASLEEVVILLPKHGLIRPLNLPFEEGPEPVEGIQTDDRVSTGAIEIPVPEGGTLPEEMIPTPMTSPTPTANNQNSSNTILPENIQKLFNSPEDFLTTSSLVRPGASDSGTNTIGAIKDSAKTTSPIKATPDGAKPRVRIPDPTPTPDEPTPAQPIILLDEESMYVPTEILRKSDR